MARETYTSEYRAHLISLARQGRSAESLARDSEPSAPTIRGWVQAAYEPDRGPIAEDKDAKIRALERECAALREEREIVKKRQPGSLRRPHPARRGVLVHRGESGESHDSHHVP